MKERFVTTRFLGGRALVTSDIVTEACQQMKVFEVLFQRRIPHDCSVGRSGKAVDGVGGLGCVFWTNKEDLGPV